MYFALYDSLLLEIDVFSAHTTLNFVLMQQLGIYPFVDKNFCFCEISRNIMLEKSGLNIFLVKYR